MRDRTFRVLATIAIVAVTALGPASMALGQSLTAERIAPAARAAAAAGGRVRVVVVFDVPELETPQGRGERGRASAAERIASARGRVLARVPAPGLEVVHAFDHVNAVAVWVDAAGLDRLEGSPDVRRVDLDDGGQGHLSEAIPLAALDTVQGLGLSGAGITVAVVDSGYDSDHVDLADDLVAETCFCSRNGGCCPGGGAIETGPGSAEDDHGHGTNVSGILTGAGNVAAAGGAPDVAVIAVKVLDSANSFCCTSDVVAGLDWLIQNRPDVDLVNMSLGTFARYPGDCDTANANTLALADAIDTLRAMGVAVFASAGNQGSGTSMTAPACVANAISVGAVWDAALGSQSANGCVETDTAPDQVACFSNSDATTDLFAPGARTNATGIGGGMSTFTGTSQATPLAAACAALLLEDDPSLLPDEVESFMKMSPTRVTDATNGLDFPRLDCRHALAVPEPAGLAGQLAALGALGAARSVHRARRRGGAGQPTRGLV